MADGITITDDMVFGEVGIYEGDVIIHDRESGYWFYPTDEQMEAIDVLWPEELRKPKAALRIVTNTGAIN